VTSLVSRDQQLTSWYCLAIRLGRGALRLNSRLTLDPMHINLLSFDHRISIVLKAFPAMLRAVESAMQPFGSRVDRLRGEVTGRSWEMKRAWNGERR